MRRTTRSLVDGSRLIVEALVRAGGDVYIGYPITPANLIYAYAQQRFPEFHAAPDEITALQWAAGYAASGKIPVVATSFPGLALMIESLNMFYMMELPLVLVLVQRLGPSTGSATVGAEGDLLLLRGVLSGGYLLPVFSPADSTDCWRLAAVALRVAVTLRTPVVLMTTKETAMTAVSLDLTSLPRIDRVQIPTLAASQFPYEAGDDLVPPFSPVGNSLVRVRLNASTHDQTGLIRDNTPEALTNTRRLQEKIRSRMKEYQIYDYDRLPTAEELLISYGASGLPTRTAAADLRRRGIMIDLLMLQTLIPLPDFATDLADHYRRIYVVEENITGALREMLFGQEKKPHIVSIGRIGRPVSPAQIIEEVESWQTRS